MSSGLVMRGDVELARKWAALPAKVQSAKHTRIVLNAGCGVMARAAAATAASKVHDTGLLAKNIIVRYPKQRYAGKRIAIVGARSKMFFVRKTAKGKWRGVSRNKVKARREAGDEIRRVNPAKYAHLVEYGVHERRPKDKKAMKAPWGFTKKAKAVGPKPFMRPAFDATSSAALSNMGRTMDRIIREAMRG
jgi:hypothetical protein